MKGREPQQSIMPVRISTYSWGEKRRRGEGVRLSCTRYLPRGVRKKDYARNDFFDVWLPTLAPSRALISRLNIDKPGEWKRFIERYRIDMKRTDARQVIRTLANLARRTPISIGCSCTGLRCHRFTLEKLIRAAAAGKF
jgi:uncharacterized protein YeaO (DUF488 family)